MDEACNLAQPMRASREEDHAEQIRGQLEIGPDINYCLGALKRRGIKL
jgi:hypothetical protein